MSCKTTIEAPPPALVEIVPPPAPEVLVEVAAESAVEVTAQDCVTEIEPPAEIVIEVLGAGLRGPPGPPGASFNFTQATPSALWTINHELGFRPVVALFTVGGIAFVGQIQHTSANQTLVHLNSPMAGSARLN